MVENEWGSINSQENMTAPQNLLLKTQVHTGTPKNVPHFDMVKL